MPLTNVLLVKYADGYIEVEDAASVATHGRREGLLELGYETRLEVVQRIANSVLSYQARRRRAIVVDPMPVTAPEYAWDYRLGDTVTGGGGTFRVQGVTVTMDDEGRVSTIPELLDPITLREQAVNRLLKRMADGALGGRTSAASPSAPNPIEGRPTRVVELTTFSYDGPLVSGLVSPPYNPAFPMQLTQVVAGLRVPGGGNSAIAIIDASDVILHTTFIGPGDPLVADDVDPPVYVDATMQLRTKVLIAGAGAAGLVVQPRATTT